MTAERPGEGHRPDEATTTGGGRRLQDAASDERRTSDAAAGERRTPDAARPEDDYDRAASSPFPHPPWTVGLVLVAGVITLLFGLLVNPIWLLVGSPFVIALFLWLYVRVFVRP